MRKLINVFFVSAGLMLLTNIANAQQKFGHVNTDEIYATMPEAKTAQTALKTFADKLQADLEKMGNEYQTKLKAAEDKQKTISEANKEVVGKELQAAATELQDLNKRIQEGYWREKSYSRICKYKIEYKEIHKNKWNELYVNNFNSIF